MYHLNARPYQPDPPFDRRAIPGAARESHWLAKDGHAIRRIDWQKTDGVVRGSLLFLPGRGDAYEKYLEPLDHWHRQGWNVTATDWRGQTGSGRYGYDAKTGHIEDFATWVADLAALWADWKASTPGPHVLIGHSMGGHLALRAVAEDAVDPAALVLSTPMLGFITHGVPKWLMHGIARAMAALGDPRRPAWKWSEKPGALPEDRILLLTHDAVKYEDEIWWRAARPELDMGSASWRWVERAYASTRFVDRADVLARIKTPTLLLGCRHDKLVALSSIKRAAKHMPAARLVLFGKEARHEILREVDAVRDRVLAEIDAFLAATV